MHDEDSGEEIRCFYCGSTEDCPHLLAVIDRSFIECTGGWAYDRYDEFSSAIESSFLPLLSPGAGQSVEWGRPELAELWQSASEAYSEEDDFVSLDGYVLTRLIVELLEMAGGEQPSGSIDDGGGPGYASSISLFYARDPQQVFERALARLKRDLDRSE